MVPRQYYYNLSEVCCALLYIPLFPSHIISSLLASLRHYSPLFLLVSLELSGPLFPLVLKPLLLKGFPPLIVRLLLTRLHYQRRAGRGLEYEVIQRRTVCQPRTKHLLELSHSEWVSSLWEGSALKHEDTALGSGTPFDLLFRLWLRTGAFPADGTWWNPNEFGDWRNSGR